MATVAGVKIKTKAKKITSVTIRENAKRDHSPKWDGCETWTESQFLRHFHSAMQYYRLESSGKELKAKVIDWMGRNGYDKATISAFKKTKDNRCGTTVGAIAACLVRGMQTCRPDFNRGRDTATWLGAEIVKVIAEGKDDIDDEAVAEVKSALPVVSIQDRVRDASYAMTLEIEDAIEAFSADPDTFDPKAFKVLNLLKGHQAKAAHARIIRGFYERNLNELVEAATSKDEQIKEAYSHLSKASLKKITAFYQEVVSACDMLAAEAKVNRAPRKTKAVSKDKLVAKLKYMKTNEPLKLVSVNPVDIIGAKELWVYNNKTRKLGKYVADEYKELAVKGTTILNFNVAQSVQKTLRKPVDQLKDFKAAGKVVLRKFLEDINAVDTKLNGRVNEDIMLLKIA